MIRWGDTRQFGRFTWAQTQDKDFPSIWNVKPGVENKFVNSGEPINATAPYYMPNKKKTRVIALDGKGDFLTIVSHINDIEKPLQREYGCDIKISDRIDKLDIWRIYFDWREKGNLN